MRWAFYEPSKEYDSDGRVVPSVKILFGGTILVDHRLDSNSAYRVEAVGIFTVTTVLHFLGIYLSQQQIDTSLICDNKELCEMHKKIHKLRHETCHSSYDRGRYNPTNNSVLQTTQLQIRLASRACRVTAGG